MKPNCKKTGWTLTELLVVMAVMAILMGISVPAAKKLIESFEGSTGARSIIDAALSNARAIAVREQRYAGVRFQADLSGKQYLVFIIHDRQNTNLANGFRTVEGRKPMPLPKNIGVISTDLHLESGQTPDTLLGTSKGWNDAGTFSVVFSPQGSFTIHPVRIRNRDGKTDNSSKDKIFNTQTNVTAKTAVFIQDDYSSSGLDEEKSTSSFSLYNQKELNKYPAASRWTSYLSKLDDEFVNPYTGQLVEK